MNDYGAQRIARAIESAMISPNVYDSNLEPANIVDALNSIAVALHSVADAIRQKPGRPRADNPFTADEPR